MSESPDAIDQIVAGWRRARWPAAVVFVLSLPIAVAVLTWTIDNPSDAHSTIAVVVGSIVCAGAATTFMAWRFSSRARYIDALQWLERRSKPYHDLSKTRMCPRCGLPMDRLMGGAFYTGPPSPRELCHRCLHADDCGGPEIPE